MTIYLTTPRPRRWIRAWPRLAECLADPAMQATRRRPHGGPHGAGTRGAGPRRSCRLIGAEPREIIFTSGATEANNPPARGRAAIVPPVYAMRPAIAATTARTEHKSVLDALRQLEKEGFAVTGGADEAGRVPTEPSRRRCGPTHREVGDAGQ
jgi:hypothetical protein